jgi:membrane associated rhomboid family serine protease
MGRGSALARRCHGGGSRSASANGGGVAFFAHAGGFLFGVLATRVFTGVGRIAPQTQ